MVIPITPVRTYPGTAHSLRVSFGQVELGEGASFQWELLDANGAVVAGPDRVALTDEQYNAWGDDDTDVAYAVAANVGVEPVLPEPPAP